MNEIKCEGCASILQSENESMQGYIPFEKFISGTRLCKRCFRLKNYGELPQEKDDKDKYISDLKETIKKSDILMPIFDIIDLKASMNYEILDYINEKPTLAVINKLDLLPSYFTKTEIASYVKEIFTQENIFPLDYSFVSVKKEFGIKGIFKKLSQISGKKEFSVCVCGVSNVGKSSVLSKILKNDKITISKYSGTTKSSIKNTIKYKDIKITFYDTAGLISNGRITELLDKKTASLLVPSKQIDRKAFRIKKDQVFMFSNLMYFKANSNFEIQVFASKNIQFHITNEDKAKQLFNSNYFKFFSDKEHKKYLENEFETRNIVLEKGFDLEILGLGFILIKKGNLDIDLYLPKKVETNLRDSISKLRRQKEEELLW